MTLPVCQFRGEESLSVVRRGRWVWKYYKPLDPRGIWPGEHFWREQLTRRAELSRALVPPLLINPVRRWFPDRLIAVSRFIPAARPTNDADVEYVKLFAPKWLGDVTPRNVIVSADGPVLIDFCVR